MPLFQVMFAIRPKRLQTGFPWNGYTFALFAQARGDSLNQQIALLPDSLTSDKIARLCFHFAKEGSLAVEVLSGSTSTGCQLWRELGYAQASGL